MLITACKPTVPKDIIQPNDMEDLLCDYYLAKAMGTQLADRNEGSDYRQNLYVEGAFRKHGVTQAEFDSSMVYYYGHANYLEDIYQRVSERLEKQAMVLGANEGELGRYAVLNANGDTANIWTGRTNILLSPQPPRNRLVFELETDSTSHKGDVFLFQFTCDYIYQSGAKDGVVVLNVYFEEDTIISRAVHFSNSGLIQLRLESPQDLTPCRINGFIYVGDGNTPSTVTRLLFLNNLQLIRFHRNERKHDNREEPKTLSQDSVASTVDRERPDTESPSSRDTIRKAGVLLSTDRRTGLH